jgi:hypothetical protein
MDIIKTVNDGRKIADTNYWKSDYARNGYCYLSINAGAYRLLVPKYGKDWVKECQSAQAVILSRGTAYKYKPPKDDALEILFEDNTDSPFTIMISPEQMDRMPADEDQGWKGVFHLYFDGSREPVIEFQKVYYRRVQELPCLKRVE